MRKTITWLLSGLAVALLLLPLGCGGNDQSTTATPFATRTPLPTFTVTPVASPAPTPTPTLQPTTTPTPGRPADVNPFTGIKVDDPATLQRRPLLVKIENAKESRPQTGLLQADLVYEYLVEYGITRFAALFITEEPEKVGPIRSARPMDLELVAQHDAALCFSGASIPMKKLMREKAPDLVRLSNAKYGEPYFYRVNRGADIAWEHTLYTNVAQQRAWLRSLNEERPVPQRGFQFDEAAPLGQPVTKIHVPYPRSSVDYVYDPESKLYQRQVAGEDFVDEATGQVIAQRNVIVQFVKGEESIFVNDPAGGVYLYVYEMMGEGRAILFRDGVMVEGKWQRHEQNEMTRFFDSAGDEVKLAPGPTWILFVLEDMEVKVE